MASSCESALSSIDETECRSSPPPGGSVPEGALLASPRGSPPTPTSGSKLRRSSSSSCVGVWPPIPRGRARSPRFPPLWGAPGKFPCPPPA